MKTEPQPYRNQNQGAGDGKLGLGNTESPSVGISAYIQELAAQEGSGSRNPRILSLGTRRMFSGFMSAWITPKTPRRCRDVSSCAAVARTYDLVKGIKSSEVQ